MAFKKATREKAKLRLALIGPSGSGKTYTALIMAKALAQGGPIAVIDTERGSASKYANDVAEFDVCELESFSPLTYAENIEDAAAGGYPVLIIDSLSHAWTGTDGALDQVDKRGGRFDAWKHVTPQIESLVDTMLRYPGHVIVTMRVKQAYEVTKDDRGKTKVEKLGLAPRMREGIEYELDVVADMNTEHTMTVAKSRCPALADRTIRKPGADVAEILLDWLAVGSDPAVDRALALVAKGELDAARELWPVLSRSERQTVSDAVRVKKGDPAPSTEAEPEPAETSAALVEAMAKIEAGDWNELTAREVWPRLSEPEKKQVKAAFEAAKMKDAAEAAE